MGGRANGRGSRALALVPAWALAATVACGGNKPCAQGYAGTPGYECQWNDPDLSGLSVGPGTLEPTFSPSTYEYSVTVPPGTEKIDVTATVPQPRLTSITIQGQTAASGMASSIPVEFGETKIFVEVVPQSRFVHQEYRITAIRKSADEPQ